jgi:hypothetical protein
MEETFLEAGIKRNVSFQFLSRQKSAELSEGYFCSESFKIEMANCNPFPVNTDGLNDSTLATMSSLTGIQRR